MTPLTDALWPKIVRPGSRVYLGGGAACPQALVESFLRHAGHIGDLELVHELVLGPTPWADARYETSLRVTALGLDSKPEGAARHVEYTPCYRHEISGLIRQSVLRPAVVLIMVSPPDAQGYCSMGPSVGSAVAAVDEASVVIAQINRSLPRTQGQSFIHASRIGWFIDQDQPPVPLPPRQITAVHRRIGEYAAQLIDEGSTIQAGLAAASQAVVEALGEHRRLGLHTLVLSPAEMALILSGAADNSRKTLDPGLSVASWVMGSPELYVFVDGNPHVHLHPSDYVAHPGTLMRQHNLVAINSALAVDLTGQVTIEPNPQDRLCAAELDFIGGAGLSPGGASIIAMPSSAGEGDARTSRVLLRVDPAGGFGSTRAEVHHVVTEYGIASLRGRSLRQRVMELIQIAHPDFREDLLRQAREHKLLPGNIALPPPYEPPQGRISSRRVTLRDGQRYLLRPLNPSDDHRLQAFFYSHSEDTLHRRYGFTVTRMSQQRAYELVSVDQNHDLALGVFEVQGPREVIHAVGRYYLDKNRKSAEMAFVVGESKRRVGMARTLLEEMLVVAAGRHVRRLWAQVDRDNVPMLKLFQRYGAELAPGDEPNTMVATVHVEPSETLQPEGKKYSILRRMTRQ